ncbi:Uncharacterised protein [uncultured archaeon]|nr:Uncharacterised protein [uncultured archaeon]
MPPPFDQDLEHPRDVQVIMMETKSRTERFVVSSNFKPDAMSDTD